LSAFGLLPAVVSAAIPVVDEFVPRGRLEGIRDIFIAARGETKLTIETNPVSGFILPPDYRPSCRSSAVILSSSPLAYYLKPSSDRSLCSFFFPLCPASADLSAGAPAIDVTLSRSLPVARRDDVVDSRLCRCDVDSYRVSS